MLYLFLKVSNIKQSSSQESLGTGFHLYCPKENLPHKIFIFKNGTTKDDLNFNDLCKGWVQIIKKKIMENSIEGPDSPPPYYGK